MSFQLDLPDSITGLNDPLAPPHIPKHSESNHQGVYICSPFNSEDPDQRKRNMFAARFYMLYCDYAFNERAQAPHAYLPVLLNDDIEDERRLALSFGLQLLRLCSKIYICGDRISAGMEREIKAAVCLKKSIYIFNPTIYQQVLQIAMSVLRGSINITLDLSMTPLSLCANELHSRGFLTCYYGELSVCV